VRDEAMPLQQIKAEIALMTSPKLVRAVLQEPATRAEGKSLASIDPQRGIGAHLLLKRSSIEAMAAALSDRIVAEPVTGTNLVDVSLVDEDPVWAAEFVNELVRQHIRRIGDMADQPQARGFYSDQRELLAERWQEARARLTQFKASELPELLSGDEEHLFDVVSGLERQLVAAQTQALELEAKSRYLSDEIERHPETVASESRVSEDDTVALLEQRVLDLEIERSELLTKYRPTSTVLRDLERRLEEARVLLEEKEGDTSAEELTAMNPSYQALETDIVTTEAALTAVRARVEALQSQLARYRRDFVAFDDVSAELERLEAEVESAEEAYGEYSRQQEAARFSSAFGESGIVNVSVIEAAEAPTTPLASQAKTVFGFWTIAGLVAGAVLGLVRDVFDPTLQSARRMSRITHLAIAARIPRTAERAS